MALAPSTRRRATERISAIVMSAVSSVRTPGVLVTVMERPSAEATSILSTPLPKLAMSFICSPAWAIRCESMRSVMVGTSTSAVRIASTSSSCVSGLSLSLRRVSNSSHMRVSITSGSRRVTTTSGFFFGISLVVPSRSLVVLQRAFLRLRYDLRRVAAADEKTPTSLAGFNPVLTTIGDKTNTPPRRDSIRLPSR